MSNNNEAASSDLNKKEEKPQLTLERAKQILSAARRDALVDHAFGDAEISWFNSDGNEIASAYKGRQSSVWIKEGSDWSATTFEDKPDDHQWNSIVYDLLHLGQAGRYFRNDMGD